MSGRIRQAGRFATTGIGDALPTAFVELAFDGADDAAEADIERSGGREGDHAADRGHRFAFGFHPEFGNVRGMNEDTLRWKIARFGRSWQQTN